MSPAPTIGVICAPFIFRDGFETGRFTAWSSAACEQGTTVNEADSCTLHFPLELSLAPGANSGPVWGRI